ncbi:MAG TPA: polysaccharide deacetylase family protein [Burkholderiaceae bacterium]|nr:polysaccharide deacetylase family protein [Burkholderiaceae bacterium]
MMRCLAGRLARAAAALTVVLLVASCTGVPPASVAVAAAVPEGPPPAAAWGGRVGIVVEAAHRGDVLADVWRRAAAEQGLPAELVDEDSVVEALGRNPRAYAALVLPDGLMRFASDDLVSAVARYANAGGRLLVVFDAATLSPQGFYAPGRSRLSDLVGVDYALYDRLLGDTFHTTPVYASAAAAERLGLPPGKTVGDVPGAPAAGFALRLATYDYARLVYPSIVTRGAYAGEPLLRAADGGLVAGIRTTGRGRVLFANLPLGELKLGVTDGWLLHRFLRLLAREASVPVLAMTPDAVGGMVMNLHCDSNAALRPLQLLDASGFFDDGPYSIHVTAGPGLNVATDHLGIDVPHNPPFQRFLRSLVERGHEIGSHGGWIHNDWAEHVTPDSEAQHAELLELNGAALAAADGVPVRVYSSPSGNHPPWVTHWLRRHGYVAFYTTADSGSAPTRLYRGGVLEDDAMWAFPIMSLGTAASFEDAANAGLDERALVRPWLEALPRFVAAEREVRLVYFHPTGINLYRSALAAWVERSRELAAAGRFRWYTMAALAAFLDRREAARWRVEAVDGGVRITASSGDTLEDVAWVLPADRFLEPRVHAGSARVRRDGEDWVVVATGGHDLVIDAAGIGK